MGEGPRRGGWGSRPVDARLTLHFPGVKHWLFCPGMLFQARDKWWGDRGPRPRPHEGLDLLFYRDGEERLACVAETTPLPAVCDGQVLGIIPDFLGRSVILECSDPDRTSGWLYLIYAHTRPVAGIEAGKAVRRGDAIATVAVPEGSPFPMPPHLHVSVAWSSGSVPRDRFDWHTMGDSDAFSLLDPLEVLLIPHRLMGNESPPCKAP